MNKELRAGKMPFSDFLKKEASAGIILIFITAFSLILSNLPFTSSFSALWEFPFQIGIGNQKFSFPLIKIINDGLMALFFLLVGLEIKRELLIGELSSIKKAALPVFAAAGGMIVPAFIFFLFNFNKVGHSGWAIPIATDIAFVVGILVLLKKHIPQSVRVFLTALAIVDDIGAVLIIALFFTSSISILALKIAMIMTCFLFMMNFGGVRSTAVYVILGIGLWLAVLFSGVHSTIAGVVLAFTIPSNSNADYFEHFGNIKNLISRTGYYQGEDGTKSILLDNLPIIADIKESCKELIPILQRVETQLHPWVSFFIIPLFVFANAGVAINFNTMDSLFSPLGLGIFLGLFVGKQFGVFFFTYFAIKLKISEPIAGISYRQLYGASILSGIGFTMSLFITNLSFPNSVELIDTAKISILAASFLSGFLGYFLLKSNSRIKTNKKMRLILNKRKIAEFFDF